MQDTWVFHDKKILQICTNLQRQSWRILITKWSNVLTYFGIVIMRDTNRNPVLKVPLNIKERNFFVICKVLQICEMFFIVKSSIVVFLVHANSYSIKCHWINRIQTCTDILFKVLLSLTWKNWQFILPNFSCDHLVAEFQVIYDTRDPPSTEELAQIWQTSFNTDIIVPFRVQLYLNMVSSSKLQNK